ncbi:SDR family oxidoreductase [Chitinophaga pinensis]|uniref:SDR family oxidoreductase n=1 Tax=Chitinophaga pinensis TaxID=79329 RepID=A0A5C6LXV6_9BACT|nr:SDR family oxidoreductase [Chitinophaga pinensis]TWW02245.1 SDR family oxidoreductase [Chitinophaga pinensis]
MKKVILITGASTGLGKVTAQLFAAKGWTVIATMRDPSRATDLDHENIQVLPLDVTDLAQIEDIAKKVTANAPVDVVFNNAGYGLVGALEALTDEQIVRQLNTNTLGVIRVTKAFVPYLRAQGRGLIINTTSIAGLTTYPLGSLYHASKWAIEGWSESMSFELAPHNIRIKTVSPGGITTDFMGRSLDLAQHEAYTPLFNKLMAGMDGDNSIIHFSTPEQIAEVVYEAATDDKDQLRYLAGPDAKAAYARRVEIGAEAFRQEVAERFAV